MYGHKSKKNMFFSSQCELISIQRIHVKSYQSGDFQGRDKMTHRNTTNAQYIKLFFLYWS